MVFNTVIYDDTRCLLDVVIYPVVTPMVESIYLMRSIESLFCSS